MKHIRYLAVGLLSGLLGGLAWGIAARVAMRIVALAADQPTEFSIGGTLGIMIMGAVFGAPFGLLFATVRNRYPAFERRAGLLFGALVLLLLGVPFYLGPLSGEATPNNHALAVGIFAALLVGFGMFVTLVYRWLEQRIFGEAQYQIRTRYGLTFLIATIAIGAALVRVMVVGIGE